MSSTVCISVSSPTADVTYEWTLTLFLYRHCHQSGVWFCLTTPFTPHDAKLQSDISIAPSPFRNGFQPIILIQWVALKGMGVGAASTDETQNPTALPRKKMRILSLIHNFVLEFCSESILRAREVRADRRGRRDLRVDDVAPPRRAALAHGAAVAAMREEADGLRRNCDKVMGWRRVSNMARFFVCCSLRESICESAMSRDRREGRKKRVAACCCSAIVTLVPKMEQGSAAYDVRNTLTILDSLPFLHLVSIKNGVFQLNLLKFGTSFPSPLCGCPM